MPALIDSEIIQLIKSAAAGIPARIYLVGGAVRDFIRKKDRITDFDFVISDHLDKFTAAFCSRVHGKTILWSNKDRRVVFKQNNKYIHVDFSAMSGRSITEDLENRDITVNAMAFDINRLDAISLNDLIDPMNGRQDIQKKLIKASHPRSFMDDPVRILRALRFSRKFDYTVSPETLDLMRKAAPLICNCSVERIKKEFFTLLDADQSEVSLKQMDDIGILNRLVPEAIAFKGQNPGHHHVHDLYDHSLETVARLKTSQKLLSKFSDADFLIRNNALDEKIEDGVTRKSLLTLAALLHDSGKPATARTADSTITFYGHETAGMNINRIICKRLGLGKKAQTMVSGITGHHMRILHLSLQEKRTDRAIRRFIISTANFFYELLLLSIADTLATADQSCPDSMIKVITQLLSGYRHHENNIAMAPLLNGHDIMLITGLKNSPRIGQLLNRLCELEAKGEIETREEAFEWLNQNKNTV